MMYQKASCFHDEEIANKILHTDNVARIKQMGRAVKNYNDNYWSGVRQIIVYKGLQAKFSQNEELKEKLLGNKRRNIGRMRCKRSNMGNRIGHDRLQLIRKG